MYECQQTVDTSYYRDLQSNGLSEFLSQINFLIHLVAMSMNISFQSYFLHAKQLLTVNWQDSGSLFIILPSHP